MNRQETHQIIMNQQSAQNTTDHYRSLAIINDRCRSSRIIRDHHSSSFIIMTMVIVVGMRGHATEAQGVGQCMFIRSKSDLRGAFGGFFSYGDHCHHRQDTNLGWAIQARKLEREGWPGGTKRCEMGSPKLAYPHTVQ